MTPSPDIARLRDEFGNQYDQLRREKWVRLPATALAFATGLIYLSPWIIVPLALVNLAADVVASYLLRDVERLISSPLRRAVAAGSTFLMELAFVTPAGFMWHMEDPFAKSLAVGLAASAMMHLSTVRSIHLPHGLWGAAGLYCVVLVFNSAYWIKSAMWMSLALTTLIALTSLAYFLMAMVTNHTVHAESSAGRRAAQEAAAAKERLLATISHELRTPLNAILGMGHAELAAATTPESRNRLSVLVGSAAGLSAVLDDILDISAARDGRLAIRPAVWVPADEIAATVQLFRHGGAGDGASDRGGTVKLDLAPELSGPALFDRQRLRQCLSNLLSNALRHGGGAAVQVRAGWIGRDGAAPLLDLTVADDGPGVPDALRAILFEPFVRRTPAEGDATRQGQGLGLSIARLLARQMGGDVLLDPPAEQGRGAVFRLRVALPPAAVTVQPAPALRPLQGRRVLVVDDIATNRLVANSLIGLAGAEVAEAASGAEALDRLAEGGFDAVCLDMNMPGLDGLATLARIRALDGAAARVAVVAMTADAGEAQRSRYLAAGCDGYLAKPITPETVGAVLSSVLAARGSAAAVPS